MQGHIPLRSFAGLPLSFTAGVTVTDGTPKSPGMPD